MTNNNIGLNYNEAINMYCPVKSIVVLLEFYERFVEGTVLSLIAEKMKEKKYYGMAVGLKINGTNMANFTMVANFNKVNYFSWERS